MYETNVNDMGNGKYEIESESGNEMEMLWGIGKKSYHEVKHVK